MTSNEHRWEPWPPADVAPLPWRWGRVLDRAGLVVVAAAGLVLRVLQRSPLWLDEALSANIAALPLGDIPGALKRDGHPPLYYVLLHVWQDVVGDGDVAIRLLSATIGLALIPLAWVTAGRIAGRRAAWAAALVVTLNPYVLRYSTEARMYELVMVLVLAGWLVADHALRRPAPWRLLVVALLVAALLWTHYWGLWLVGAAGVGLLIRAGLAHRRGERSRRRSSLLVAGALVVGALLFLPWVPTLLYQSAHTGTPWAAPSMPTEIAAVSLIDLGGGAAGESVLLAMALGALMVVGLFGAAASDGTITLDLRTRPEVRRLALLVVGTLAVAVVASYAGGAGYASRYFAVVAPLVLVLVGVGASRISTPVAFRVVLAVVLLLGTMAAVRAAVTRPRTQAREVAEAITAAGPVTGPDGPVIAVCPDQLGPSLSRELPAGADVVTYPDLGSPALVDWVDYADRHSTASPDEFAAAVVARAGDRDLWLVWSGGYRTHAGTCEEAANALLRARPAGAPVVAADPDAFEPSNAYYFPGVGG